MERGLGLAVARQQAGMPLLILGKKQNQGLSAHFQAQHNKKSCNPLSLSARGGSSLISYSNMIANTSQVNGIQYLPLADIIP